jgi:hypothetical protein
MLRNACSTVFRSIDLLIGVVERGAFVGVDLKTVYEDTTLNVDTRSNLFSIYFFFSVGFFLKCLLLNFRSILDRYFFNIGQN